jgi:hypothetical protein
VQSLAPISSRPCSDAAGTAAGAVTAESLLPEEEPEELQAMTVAEATIKKRIVFFMVAKIILRV